MNYYLSLSDLMLVDGFPQAVENGSKQDLENYLHQNGMDMGKKYEEKNITHRNLQGFVVTCPRYCGFERIDRNWIKSGAASMQAVIASTTDKEMIKDLEEMSKEGFASTGGVKPKEY